MNKYDYVIIGAGPSGLTFATLCALNGKTALIIEKDKVIGGCHRVNRIFNKDSNEFLFSEHGPRIYSSSFLNFKQILKLININFYDYFVPYKFSSLQFTKKTIFEILSLKESLILFSTVFFNTYNKNTTMKDFLVYNNFSYNSQQYIDGICRITDGAGYDKYTLYQFIALINQQSLYKMYQPKKPLDIGLFKYWYDFLINTKLIDINCNTTIDECIINKDYKIIDSKKNTYFTDKLILACPPNAIKNIITKLNIQDSFGDFNLFKDYIKNTEYLHYIPIIFHWNKSLDLEPIWNFPPTSEWGVLFTILTDYMTFEEKSSKTVISTMITKSNINSSVLLKNANQCTEEELINEVFRQLKIYYPNLSSPTASILSKSIYKEDDIWKNADTAFFNSPNNNIFPFKSDKYNNLYTIGSHNGKSDYYFTSFESAVSNSIIAFNTINTNNTDNKVLLNIIKPLKLIPLIYYLFIIIVCYLTLLIYSNYYFKIIHNNTNINTLK
jgi:hypothetical protein